jgi:hypothetical protein
VNFPILHEGKPAPFSERFELLQYPRPCLSTTRLDVYEQRHGLSRINIKYPVIGAIVEIRPWVLLFEDLNQWVDV